MEPKAATAAGGTPFDCAQDKPALQDQRRAKQRDARTLQLRAWVLRIASAASAAASNAYASHDHGSSRVCADCGDVRFLFGRSVCGDSDVSGDYGDVAGSG